MSFPPPGQPLRTDASQAAEGALQFDRADSAAGLRGLNVGLLCDEPSSPEALIAYRAAADLGAHVSLVRPCFSEQQDATSIQDMAHLLGRLYDLLVCVALAPRLVEALRATAGVPVVGDHDLGTACAAEQPGEAPSAGPGADDPLDSRAAERTLLWERALVGSVS